jgi:hypothetical protein
MTFLGLAILAMLLVFAPTAGAALDYTDTATGTGALANENSPFGNNNTADGYKALNANYEGFYNTAVGSHALEANYDGIENTAAGATALTSNTTGAGNTAAGMNALVSNTTGDDNTAAGEGALVGNTTANNNTAAGWAALAGNTTGEENTAVGFQALLSNISGNHNTAAGTNALHENSVGGGNTALGFDALSANQYGFGNTALGQLAGVTETAGNANTAGSENTFLGFDAGPGTSTQLSNATAIGADARVSENNAVVLGAPEAKVGIGTTAPKSLLQVGVPSTSYGDYLQIPMVTIGSAPPATDCNSGGLRPTIFPGRLVLQYDAQKVRTTLWSCSAAGVWTKLAQG